MATWFQQRPNDPLAVYRHKVDPFSWWCPQCGRPARDVHDSAYECHTCSDWGGCGGGCTLVALSCEGCGRTEYLKGPQAGEVVTASL